MQGCGVMLNGPIMLVEEREARRRKREREREAKRRQEAAGGRLA